MDQLANKSDGPGKYWWGTSIITFTCKETGIFHDDFSFHDCRCIIPLQEEFSLSWLLVQYHSGPNSCNEVQYRRSWAVASSSKGWRGAREEKKLQRRAGVIQAEEEQGQGRVWGGENRAAEERSKRRINRSEQQHSEHQQNSCRRKN